MLQAGVGLQKCIFGDNTVALGQSEEVTPSVETNGLKTHQAKILIC